MRQVGISCGIGYLRNSKFMVLCQQSSSLLQTDILDEIACGKICQLFQLAVHMHPAQPDFGSEHFNIQCRIIQMFVSTISAIIKTGLLLKNGSVCRNTWVRKVLIDITLLLVTETDRHTIHPETPTTNRRYL